MLPPRRKSNRSGRIATSRCKTPLKNAVLGARPADIVYAKTNSPRGPRIEMKFKPQRKRDGERERERKRVLGEHAYLARLHGRRVANSKLPTFFLRELG